MYNLLKKRTYDIGAVTDKTVRVKFNGEAVPFRQFEQYIDMYIGSKKETKRLFESHPRWEYAVSMSPLDEFTQVSFVNGIICLPLLSVDVGKHKILYLSFTFTLAK